VVHTEQYSESDYSLGRITVTEEKGNKDKNAG